MSLIRTVNSFLGLTALNNEQSVTLYCFAGFIITAIVALWLMQFRLQSNSRRRDSVPVIASEISSTLAAVVLLFATLGNFISVIR